MSTFIYDSKGIPVKDKIELQKILTIDNPIGVRFLELYGNQDRNSYQYLFDGHSQYLYEQKSERPSIIVGRKGSGKSTYLNNLSFKDNIIPIQITQWKIMDEVQKIIFTLIEQDYEIRAERASYIWLWLFLSAAVIKSSKFIISNNTLKEFIKFFPISEFGDVGISALAGFAKTKIKKFFENNMSADHMELASVAWIIEDKTQAIDSIERCLSEELEKHDKYALILFDNEEDVLHTLATKDNSNLQTAKEIAISGLLNLCGRVNQGAVHFQVRYCIPAEQFFAFKALSKTTAKDFSKLHLLHWSVGELLSMIAHRYMIYLYVNKESDEKNKGSLSKNGSISDIYSPRSIRFF